MVSVTFLIAAFVSLIAVLGLLIFFIARLIGLPQIPPGTKIPIDPNSVVCSQDQVLQAWITDVQNRPGCPPWTNNYVIGEDYRMYEKFFKVDPSKNCCWYSNDVSERKLFPLPWICIADQSAKPYTVGELNQKPYSFDGEVIRYIVPACDKTCIGLIQVGQDGNNAQYQIFRFSGEETLKGKGSSAANVAKDTIITISPDCKTLEKITFQGEVVAERIKGKITIKGDPPQMIKDIISIFKQDRFYPIAGANPPLTEFLVAQLK